MKKKIIAAMIAGASLLSADRALSQETNIDNLSSKDTTELVDRKSKISATLSNTLETAVSHKGSARLRSYASAGLSYEIKDGKTVELGYSGMNEFNENLKTYFGRNVITAGMKDKDLKLIGVVNTSSQGIVNDQYGLRYMITDKLGIDYGRVDVVGSKEGANATFFLGKSLGGKSKMSVELFESINATKEGKIEPYTELQVNKEIAQGFNVFVRGEMAGVDYKNNNYLLGISKKLY